VTAALLPNPGGNAAAKEQSAKKELVIWSGGGFQEMNCRKILHCRLMENHEIHNSLKNKQILFWHKNCV
jgi:hypothetical protein